jgi:DUF305 family protein family protein
MSSLLKLTVIRGMLGFLQVIGIVVLAAGVRHWSQPVAALFSDVICAASPAPPEEAPYLDENDTAMKRMMSNMAVKFTGDVDRDFVSMMSPHHQGAIDMARAVLRYGRNEQIRRLAQEIIVTQQQEIAAMRLAIGDPPLDSAPSPTRVANSSGRP